MAVFGAMRFRSPALSSSTASGKSHVSMPAGDPRTISQSLTAPTRATTPPHTRTTMRRGMVGGSTENQSATPRVMNASALTGFMATRPGTKLLRTSTSKVQPASTPQPVSAAASAALRGTSLSPEVRTRGKLLREDRERRSGDWYVIRQGDWTGTLQFGDVPKGTRPREACA